MLLGAAQKASATSESQSHLLSPEVLPDKEILLQPCGNKLFLIQPEKGKKRKRKMSMERMQDLCNGR